MKKLYDFFRFLPLSIYLRFYCKFYKEIEEAKKMIGNYFPINT